jgi:hypothetical protein
MLCHLRMGCLCVLLASPRAWAMLHQKAPTAHQLDEAREARSCPVSSEQGAFAYKWVPSVEAGVK